MVGIKELREKENSMRDILFRGKRLDTGEFVEGYYVKDDWCEKPKHGIEKTGTIHDGE